MGWTHRENRFGVVGNIKDGKRHVNHYPKGVFNIVFKDVVFGVGLFFR